MKKGHFEERKTPTLVIDATVCDLCKQEFKGDGWGARGFDILETTIKIRQGHSYGSEGGNIQEREYHICPKCFREKLEPWLKSQGAEPTEEEHDW